jgi:hypothetical protein
MQPNTIRLHTTRPVYQKESVDHERLLLETAWHEYRPTESSLINPGLSFVQAPLPVSCLTSRRPVVSGVAHAEHRLDAEDRALRGRPDRLPRHRLLSRTGHRLPRDRGRAGRPRNQLSPTSCPANSRIRSALSPSHTLEHWSEDVIEYIPVEIQNPLRYRRHHRRRAHLRLRNELRWPDRQPTLRLV